MSVLRLIANDAIVAEYRFTLRHAREVAKLHRRMERQLDGKGESEAPFEGPKADEKKVRCEKCDRVIPPWSEVCPACTSRRQVLSRLLDYVKPYRARAIGGFVLAILVTAAGLVRPWLTQTDARRRPGPQGRQQSGLSPPACLRFRHGGPDALQRRRRRLPRATDGRPRREHRPRPARPRLRTSAQAQPELLFQETHRLARDARHQRYRPHLGLRGMDRDRGGGLHSDHRGHRPVHVSHELETGLHRPAAGPDHVRPDDGFSQETPPGVRPPVPPLEPADGGGLRRAAGRARDQGLQPGAQRSPALHRQERGLLRQRSRDDRRLDALRSADGVVHAGRLAPGLDRRRVLDGERGDERRHADGVHRVHVDVLRPDPRHRSHGPHAQSRRDQRPADFRDPGYRAGHLLESRRAADPENRGAHRTSQRQLQL